MRRWRGGWRIAGEAMRRELAEELGIACDEPEQLPVTNRFVYAENYKLERSLDHDGQDAVMFFVRLPQEQELRLQSEEIADAHWFEPDEAVVVFPVPIQRSIFQECMVMAKGC